MAQINLLSGSESGTRPTVKSGGGSLMLSFAILVLTFGTYFGTVFYKGMLQRDFDAVESESAQKKSLIVGEKANRVADFFDRMSVIDANLRSSALSPNDPLVRIEGALIPEANLSSYKYDLEKKSIETVASADSFRAVAQQLVTLKKVFSSATMEGNARVGSDGKVSATLSLIP